MDRLKAIFLEQLLFFYSMFLKFPREYLFFSKFTSTPVFPQKIPRNQGRSQGYFILWFKLNMCFQKCQISFAQEASL